jgi:hypothetical protein
MSPRLEHSRNAGSAAVRGDRVVKLTPYGEPAVRQEKVKQTLNSPLQVYVFDARRGHFYDLSIVKLMKIVVVNVRIG